MPSHERSLPNLVFVLCERKTKTENRKYHAAARPEFTEGQAVNHVD
jgi:hypothetical protein